MTSEVLTAIISGGSAILMCLISNYYQSKAIAYRIQELEKQVSKHNNLIDRTYGLESNQNVMSEQIKVVNHRLDDLERGVKHE